jgi:hypothetical protein
MAAFLKTYAREDAARHAAEALRRAGIPGRELWLLTGSARHDVRREPVGGFAGAMGPDADVGTFADMPLLRHQGAGSFAGDPDRQRQGCFADTDRVMITTQTDRSQRSRAVGYAALRRMLRETPLADDAQHVVDELAMGHAAVVVEASDIQPSDARAQLEHLRRAA